MDQTLQPVAGRLTLPIETGIDAQIHELMERLEVDAVRNSDGTELPDWVSEGLTKVYSTYFPSRGDEEWAVSVPEQRVRQYLMSRPVTAPSANPLKINVMEGYLGAQFAPDLLADRSLYWQVIDRTTGETIPVDAWTVEKAAPLPMKSRSEVVGEYPDDAASAVVTIANPEPFHVYTVNFLAKQIWDSTQLYNFITNNWAADPNRRKDRTYDVAYPSTWEHVRDALPRWLADHPEVDVVRFTTFFYHFTLAFDDSALEKYVDWFGYSAAVSIPALEDFAKEYGYALTPEDFVDGGHYNTPLRVPTQRFRDWIDFTSRRVARQAGELVALAHKEGREAMMFLGDNWIGTEPYGPYFPQIGLDAVVGSVGSAATCRMISDVPGVKYTEGRFLPYFFPDTFNPEGDPTGEAIMRWSQARRAIVRKPLDRIGYGGYLSLALEFPEFIDQMEEIVKEFRSLHDESGGALPANAKPVVAILNSWGALRTWQTYMVAHALWYKQIYSYIGVIEALAGLPLDVRFISFKDVVDTDGGVLDGVDVVINAGARDTAFSGGKEWDAPKLQALVRQFVWNGGGFIGVGAPTGRTGTSGPTLVLEDVLGVDMEIDWTLSSTRHPEPDLDKHFITEDLEGSLDTGEHPGDVVATGTNASVLRSADGTVKLSVNPYGNGRAVYIAGLPESGQNTRLLYRSVLWASGNEGEWDAIPVSENQQVEVAWYEDVRRMFVFNNSAEAQSTVIAGPGTERTTVELDSYGSTWIQL